MAIDVPLALKYRPKKLSEVIGQPIIVKAFENAFKNNTLHHAYIMAGMWGTGKTSLARIVAAMENCEKGITLEPCGKCKNCVEIFAGKSYDVKEIDGASNNGIDDMRELKKDLYQSPIYCRKKYVIIDEVHQITAKGADSSLKMIEEPPPHVRFILATTDPHKIKDTIHSRCILWRFNKVNWIELYNYVKNICKLENIDFEDAALKTIAKSSKNSVRNSLQNLQTVINFVGTEKIKNKDVIDSLGVVDNRLYYELIDAISSGDGAKSLYIINYVLMDGKEIGIILNGLNFHLSNLLKAKVCKKDLSKFAFSDEDAKKCCEQSDKITGGAILLMMEQLRNIAFSVNYNLDPQSQLEYFAIDSLKKIKILNNKIKK